MNEELQKQLAALLSSLMSTATDAKAFAAREIPPLVQEKIALGRVEETACSIALLIAVILAFMAVPRMWRASQLDSDEPLPFLGVFGGTIAGAICLVASFGQMHQTLMIWFAPRLYIVDWLKSMVTK